MKVGDRVVVARGDNWLLPIGRTGRVVRTRPGTAGYPGPEIAVEFDNAGIGKIPQWYSALLFDVLREEEASE